jgi:prepilin-type N-terminal cleavage/methylation domain-containing protein/prepilin-type processing-associated H-X9-DG protein
LAEQSWHARIADDSDLSANRLDQRLRYEKERNMEQKQASRTAFTLVELLVVIAIIGILVALLLPAIQAAREAARRSQCQNNLKQVSLAQHNHESSKKTFTPGCYGKPGDPPRAGAIGRWYDDSTWAYLLTPYIEEQGISDLFDVEQSANAADNLDARKVKISPYECPSDRAAENQFDDPLWARWRYSYAVNWGNTNKGQLDKDVGGVLYLFGGAPFTFGKGIPIGKITDGTSKTLMYSEVIPAKDAEWAGSIGDCTLCRGGQGFVTLFTPNSSTPDIVDEKCPQPDPDIKCVPRGGAPPATPAQAYLDATSLHHSSARSKHTNGVNAAMCDGSVQFYADNIDDELWRALGSSQGAETVGP